ncbi:lipase family protein [Paracoccus sp. DMF]|uniref:lipase family protein n=1 Tax=Paracoccus sp. DMF TaxID=400837 RepID=UPI001100E6BF|nr:Mbeg1-like protein [Paracoccus sp. DMF]MCV2447170.1 DUF2974 domain-containing protein [Paracoccus sp. DMF]
MLVFRGSDTEPADFAELAIGTRLTGNFVANTPLFSATRVEDLVIDESVSVAPAYNGRTMAELDASGLTREPLFENVSGEVTVNVGGWAAFRSTVTLRYTISSALYYGGNGDWAVNFAQGLGREIPNQYLKAIDDGLTAAQEAISRWNGRLVVTGHSLGGGLASTASIAIRSRHPNLVMRAITYNSAGLHQNTAHRAGGTLATAGAVPIRAVHIKDEILSSLQARGRLVPFLDDLLYWGRKTMPPAVTNPSPSRGKSPGPMSLGPLTMNLAPEMGQLPTVFTANVQELGPPMTELLPIIACANSAQTVTQFVERVVEHLVQRAGTDGNITYSQVVDFVNIFRGGRLNLSGEAFVSAIQTGQPLPPLDLGDNDYINQQLEPFANGLQRDAITFARMMIASGLYHTFIPCAYTFLIDPGPR